MATNTNPFTQQSTSVRDDEDKTTSFIQPVSETDVSKGTSSLQTPTSQAEAERLNQLRNISSSSRKKSSSKTTTTSFKQPVSETDVSKGTSSLQTPTSQAKAEKISRIDASTKQQIERARIETQKQTERKKVIPETIKLLTKPKKTIRESAIEAKEGIDEILGSSARAKGGLESDKTFLSEIKAVGAGGLSVLTDVTILATTPLEETTRAVAQDLERFVKGEQTELGTGIAATLDDPALATGQMLVGGFAETSILKALKPKATIITQKGKIEAITSSAFPEGTTAIKSTDILQIQRGKEIITAKIKGKGIIKPEVDDILIGTQKREITFIDAFGETKPISERADFNIQQIEGEIRAEGTTATIDPKTGEIIAGKFQSTKTPLPDESFFTRVIGGTKKTKIRGDPLDIDTITQIDVSKIEPSIETVGFQKQQFEITQPKKIEIETKITKTQSGLTGDLTPSELALTLSEKRKLGFFDQIKFIDDKGKFTPELKGIFDFEEGRPIIAISEDVTGKLREEVVAHELAHSIEPKILTRISKPFPYRIKPNEILARVKQKKKVFTPKEATKIGDKVTQKFGFSESPEPKPLEISISKEAVEKRSLDLTSVKGAETTISQFEKDFIKRIEPIAIEIPKIKTKADPLLGRILIMDDTAIGAQSILPQFPTKPKPEVKTTPSKPKTVTVTEQKTTPRIEAPTIPTSQILEVLPAQKTSGLGFGPIGTITTSLPRIKPIAEQIKITKGQTTGQTSEQLGRGFKPPKFEPPEQQPTIKAIAKITIPEPIITPDVKTKTKTKQDEITKQEITPITDTTTAQDTRTITDTTTKQDTRQEIKQGIIPRLIGGPKLRPRTTIIIPPTKKLGLKARTRKQAFEIIIGRKGRKVFKTTSASNLLEAIRLGKRGVKTTAAASLEIRGSGGRTLTSTEESVVEEFLGKEFRKGKKDKKFIQKREFRIGTPGEKKEITELGIAASKKKSLLKTKKQTDSINTLLKKGLKLREIRRLI